jgi:O-antigen ligase
LFVTLLVMTLAWGTFAFGGVYPWAYVPLLISCALVGAFGLIIGRQSSAISRNAPFVAALAAIFVAALLQLLPLPPVALAAVSPATDPFARATDLTAAAVWRPLSIYPAATGRSLFMLAALVVFFLGLLKAFSRYSAIQIGKALVVLGVVLAVVGIVQKATLGADVWGGMKIYGFWRPRYNLVTPFGPFVNKNHFAGWMAMVIPLTLGVMGGVLASSARYVRADARSQMLWFSTREGGQFLLLGFSALLMTAAAFMTLSRSGIGSLLVTVPLIGVVATAGHASRRLRVAITSVLVLLLLGGAVWAGTNATLTRLAEGSETLAFRLAIWRDAMTVFRDFPITGTGLNTFGAATLVYQTANRNMHFQEAHNEYLQLLAEGGLLLAIPIVIAMAALVRGIVRRFQSSDDPEVYWLRVGAVGGLVAIALQSLVEFSLQMPGNAALFVVLLAIALHTSRKVSTTAR